MNTRGFSDQFWGERERNRAEREKLEMEREKTVMTEKPSWAWDAATDNNLNRYKKVADLQWYQWAHALVAGHLNTDEEVIGSNQIGPFLSSFSQSFSSKQQVLSNWQPSSRVMGAALMRLRGVTRW